MSGYIEIVEAIYDPTVISYETLLSVFFTSHDPTSVDRQGNDSGEQYRSVIFGTPQDRETARAFIQDLENNKTFERKIVTELRPLETFYIAEDYHQNYYDNNPAKAYCQYVIDPKIRKLKEKFASYLK